MGRYDYNPMRYDYNNVPINIGIGQDGAKKATPQINIPLTQGQTGDESFTAFQRKKEYNEIKEAFTTFQQARALQKATQNFFDGEKTPSVSYETEYGRQLDNFSQYIDEMTPEEYGETFKKLTGMELEEYRNKKSENPDFRLDLTSVLETDERKVHIQVREDTMDYGQEQMEKLMHGSIQQKNDQLDSAREQYNQERQKEGTGIRGSMSTGLDYVVDFLDAGTSRSDVESGLQKEDETISELRKYAQENDIEGFALSFKKATGQDFKAENFIKLNEIRQKFQSASENNSEDLPQIEQEYKEALTKTFGNNVSQEQIENYIKTKAISHGIAKGVVIVGATALSGGLAAATAAGAAGVATAAGATAATSTVVGVAASTVVTSTAASAASAAFDVLDNKTGKEVAQNSAEIAGYTTSGIAAANTGRAVSRFLPGAAGKVAGVATEIVMDAAGSYGVSKAAGKETTVLNEGIVSTASSLIPRAAALGSGARAARTSVNPKAVRQEIETSIEGVRKEFIDQIKRERPHLSDEMTLIHAKRLQRVAEGKTPWEAGPVNEYEAQIHKKFYETKAGKKDFMEQTQKVVRTGDKKLPVQKANLTEQEERLLETYYQEGASYLSEYDEMTLYDVVRKSKPLDQDYVVYRTISAGRGSSNFNSAFIDEIKEGGIITRGTWTSTATEYDWACLQFHPDFASSGKTGGKGYVMRIKLPKGTKGIDMRGTSVRNGNQSEFMLPPNSQIKVNKIDHANQILECEYIVPKTEDYFPREEFDMKPANIGKRDHKWEGHITTEGKDTTTLTYPNRTIEKVENYKGWNVPNSDITTDTTVRPDGSTVTVKSGWEKGKPSTVEKVVKDKNGKVIYRDVLSGSN